jgi:hypothetical protein
MSLPFLLARRRRSTTLALALVVAATIGGVGARSARAATIAVNCAADPHALASTLSTAADGDVLSLQGTCTGTFEVARDVTLVGVGGAVLDAQGAGTVLTIDSGASVAVSNITFTGGNGTATSQSNAAAGGVQNAGVLTLTGVTVRGNTATVSRGQNGVGGILNIFGGSLTLVNSTVSGNGAAATVPFDTAVGGIFNACCGGSSVTITNSTVSGNTASTPSDAFGGILNSAPGQVVTLTNSTVTGNSATAPGGPSAFSMAVGGISNSGGTLALASTTLSANSVSEPNGGFLPPVAGVGNFFGGTATVAGSLIAAQSGGPNCSGLVAASDSGYNLDDGTTCAFAAANHSLSATNPLLDPAGLQDNGGPTRTIALPAGSPAVDAIPPGALGCGTTLTTDQRGVSRPSGAGCDIGAYELVPQALSVSVDIKPGETPNAVNPRNGGSIPVAILSTAAFDAPSQVDATSLRFGRTGNEASLVFCGAPEDVDRDGRRDVVCHFTTAATGFQPGDVQGVLTGKTVGGTAIRGTDSVQITLSG